MRKWITGGLLFSLLFASTAYAHVVGSFGDFLGGVKNEQTIEKLKNEIEDTKKEIQQITPRVKKLEKEFEEKMEVAESKLLFYNTIGLDTYIKFILQSDDMVDVLANQRLVEKKLEEDLKYLNQLYLDYMPLKSAKNSLESYVQLLQMIEENLESRKRFFAENKDLTLEELASVLVMNWAANTADLDEMLKEDSKLLNEQIKQFVTRKTPQSPYRLEEELFNQKSKVTYYFRSDHVYAHYRKQQADVILIGQMYKTNEKTARLQFEAGFLNGVALSNDLLKKLPGFTLDYTRLNPNSKGFYVEQMNGAIMILPVENAAE